MITCPTCTKYNYLSVYDPEISYCQLCNHYMYNSTKDKEILFSHNHVGDYQLSTREKQFKKVFDFIIQKNSNPSFLEIGAGFGGYINYANRFGFECTAVDVDNYYEKNYLNAGIKFIQQDANEFRLNISSTVVILSHIIEHLKSPKSLINYLGKQNVQYLIIEVPSSHGLIFRLSKFLLQFNILFIWKRLWQKNSNSPHLHYFSDKSINKLFNDNNFEVQETMSSRFSTFKGSFKRASATENYIISLLSVIAIQFLEILNYLLKCPENKVYIVKNLK